MNNGMLVTFGWFKPSRLFVMAPAQARLKDFSVITHYGARIGQNVQHLYSTISFIIIYQ